MLPRSALPLRRLCRYAMVPNSVQINIGRRTGDSFSMNADPGHCCYSERLSSLFAATR